MADVPALIQEHFSLKQRNTFGVEVEARYFAEISTVEELQKAISFAQNQKLPYLFLGGGSNILFTRDFPGIVIQLDMKGITEEKTDAPKVHITANGGENWHEFVQYTLAKNYGGLENLSLIPGNVGTSPMQNIGAYGVEIKDRFVKCSVLDLEENKVKTFDNKACEFEYRESVFKRAGKNRYVLLDVTFELTAKDHELNTGYGAIQSELEKMEVENPTIQDVSRAVIAIRQSKLPDPKVLGNAGSFFKNPTVLKSEFEKLQEKYADIPGFAKGDLVKIPAAWLIEQCGWKGRQEGNVASHHLQPLVLVNLTGKASGLEIFSFSGKIIESVQDKFGIELEREVNVV